MIIVAQDGRFYNTATMHCIYTSHFETELKGPFYEIRIAYGYLDSSYDHALARVSSDLLRDHLMTFINIGFTQGLRLLDLRQELHRHLEENKWLFEPKTEQF